MTSEMTIVFIYVTPLLLILAFYLYKRKKHHNVSEKYLAQAKQDGLTEPASLHPVIDPSKCLGCASCISACILPLLNAGANAQEQTSNDNSALMFAAQGKPYILTALNEY